MKKIWMTAAVAAVALATSGCMSHNVSQPTAPIAGSVTGYTHKLIRDEHGAQLSTWEPQDQVSFYTSYRFKGPLDRLTLGGGARWQGGNWQEVYNRPKGRNEEFSQDA